MLNPTAKVMAPEPVRLLQALQQCEMFAGIASVQPTHALETAARNHHVDIERLAVLWLVKLIHVQRARAAEASLVEADAELERRRDMPKKSGEEAA